MSVPTTPMMGGCPQCRTPLQFEQAADGHTYRRCPRCGWNDHDLAGYTPPVAAEEAEYEAKSAARRKNLGCLWAVVGLVITGMVALIAYFLSRAG